MNLVKEWGYEPLLHANLPTFPPLHPVMYCVVGLTILISGAYLFVWPPHRPTYPPLYPVLTARWDRPVTTLIPGGFPIILSTSSTCQPLTLSPCTLLRGGAEHLDLRWVSLYLTSPSHPFSLQCAAQQGWMWLGLRLVIIRKIFVQVSRKYSMRKSQFL
jgi:hypothetical protein